ncbi:MAG: hypothetical protein HY774_29740 [Acidobacteria bacterium]|nr:hypothetical protein [Acidobacteriota bacterium]
MLTATVNGVTTNYFYDGEGKRIKKIVNGQVTRLGSTRVIIDMAGQVVIRQDFYPFRQEIISACRQGPSVR